MISCTLTRSPLFALLLGATAACTGSKDSGADSAGAADGTADGTADGAADGTDGATDGTDGATPTVESCDCPELGICFALADQSGVEAWCTSLAANYGIATTYAAADCAPATQGTCEGLTGGDYGDLVATAYYYDGFPNEPEAACVESGGTFAG